MVISFTYSTAHKLNLYVQVASLDDLLPQNEQKISLKFSASCKTAYSCC